MGNGHTVVLSDDRSRALACSYAVKAPNGYTAEYRPPARTTDQNSRFWAMLSDVSRSKPEGRCMTPARWKAAFMQSFGHQVQFENDLEGRPFPIGHSSSRLSKAQMSELMEFISAWGSERGVEWTEPHANDR